jgi:hypothetical protein
LALACLTITTIFASFGASILFRILFEWCAFLQH